MKRENFISNEMREDYSYLIRVQMKIISIFLKKFTIGAHLYRTGDINHSITLEESWWTFWSKDDIFEQMTYFID